VLVKPAMSVETKHARAILSPTVGLSDFVRQSANLAGFIAGCYTDDVDLIRASFEDVIIEPQRRTLIPGFAEAQAGAFLNGAVGCSISGAGPTIFALAPEKDAPAVRAAMRSAFEKSDSWIVDIKSAGARLV
jgi:homoserine kinase